MQIIRNKKNIDFLNNLFWGEGLYQYYSLIQLQKNNLKKWVKKHLSNPSSRTRLSLGGWWWWGRRVGAEGESCLGLGRVGVPCPKNWRLRTNLDLYYCCSLLILSSLFLVVLIIDFKQEWFINNPESGALLPDSCINY